MESDQITFGSVCRWLKIKHLVLVNSLARTRNMHTTAEQMNVTQPAVSKLLRDVEVLLGFPLFERQTRNLVLTELGEFVARYARITLEDTESFVDQVNKLRQGGHGHLRVGTIFAATSVMLPEAIAWTKARRPLLSIEVLEQTSNHLLELLEQKKLDVIIARFTDRDCQPFEFASLGPEPFCLVANSAHPLCRLEQVPIDALGAWPWVMYPLNTPIRQRMERAFKMCGMAPPTNTVETISMQTFLQLLQAGPMLAMLPESMVQSQLLNGQLQILDTPFKVESQDYGVITRKDDSLSEPARAFVETLLEVARRRQPTQQNDEIKLSSN
jgi:DNA-binding transcriptional LysR family regulator